MPPLGTLGFAQGSEKMIRYPGGVPVVYTLFERSLRASVVCLVCKAILQKKSLGKIKALDICGSDGGNNDNVGARTYLIRTKTAEERNKLATAIQEYAPAA
ncbi:hypothetical protein HHK36_001066 [Tetracentron sinense]|uniref:Uncharacterized protein n=1 Tax=Tetracentron sinense TaxID=13715 RepID=A0A834ZT23_TETSI|nr:hypothetical protein HHK36_001066 [Tetracentron sinense]